MATKYWLKFFYEVVDDPKMGRLPDNLWRRFFECCAIAGELNQHGRLPPLTDISWRLRIDIGTLESEFDQLARIGLFDFRADNVLDGYWMVTNFEKRQKAMPKAEFMRRKRDEERQDHYYGVTEYVTNGKTDKDKDKDKDKESIFPFPEISTEAQPEDNRYRLLLGAFFTAAKLPLADNLRPRDNEAVNQWVENECTVEDIEAAVRYSTDNELTIVGPASIHKGVMIARGNRLRQPKKMSTVDMLKAAGYDG